MVIAEIATGLTGLKTALDILKGLKKTNPSGPILSEIADLQSALIEVQQGIMAANDTHVADVDRIRALEAEVARLNAWDGEKARYEMKTAWTGSVVYSLKPDMRGGEPPHWLCANCYQTGKKSFLSSGPQSPINGKVTWGCPNCSTKLVMGPGVAPQ